MKYVKILSLLLAVLIISCAQDSEQDSSDSSSTTDYSNSDQTTPVTNSPNASDNPNLAGQQIIDGNNAQAVSPTLPGNLKQGQSTSQPLDIQPLNAQQQQQATGAAAAPIKTIGDEKTAHFICPKACKGSGADAAANCPTCGSAYTHNADSPWHAANQQPQAQPQAQPQPVPGTQQPAQIQPSVQQPAQIQPAADPLPAGDHNTSHYICPDKCVGSGSLSPGKCPVCQKDYTHNAESEAHKEEMRRREQ